MDTLSAATLARQILARLTAFLKQQQDTNGPHDARDEQLYYRTRGQLTQFPGGKETLARLVEFPSDAGLQQGTRVFLEQALLADARFAAVMTGLLQPPPPPDLPEMPGSSPANSQLVPGGNTSIGGSGNVQQTIGAMSGEMVIGQQININRENERELPPLDYCPVCRGEVDLKKNVCNQGHIVLFSRLEQMHDLRMMQHGEFKLEPEDARRRDTLLRYVFHVGRRVHAENRFPHEDELLTVGLVLLRLREYDEALPFLERFTRRNPTQSYGWYALGLARLHRRRPRLLKQSEASDILTCALRASQLDSSLVTALFLAALVIEDYFDFTGMSHGKLTSLNECLEQIAGQTGSSQELTAFADLVHVPDGQVKRELRYKFMLLNSPLPSSLE